MKRILLFLILSVAVAFAQETPLPQPPAINVDFMRAEIGDLQLQISAFRQWTVSLQARITELQKENAELKMKIKEGK